MIIGICGKSGSGKSTLARMLVEKCGNAIHLDIDRIGHYVLTIEEVKEELIRSFGSNILNDQSIDRKKLGEIVFNSRQEMSKLTDITWKHMQIEIDKFLANNKGRNIILDWILLPTSKYFGMCDIKILLDIPYEIRKQRAIIRDNITEEKFDLRDKASVDFDLGSFDYVIDDDAGDKIQRLVMSL